jgi:hypothetical protein
MITPNTIRKRTNVPAEIVLNMRLFNAVRALGGTLAAELQRMFEDGADSGHTREKGPRRRPPRSR